MLTDQQLKETVDAHAEHGSQQSAARALGIPRSTFQERYHKAIARGYSPTHDMNHIKPDGYIHRGQSILRGPDGEIKLIWEKSDVDRERQFELIKEVIASMAKEIPRLPPIPAPPTSFKKLCNVYTFTDYHMGMIATYAGQEWNIKIAEDLLEKCFGAMVDQSPQASHCIIANIGDFLHSDSLDNVTPMNKHVLQQDGRYRDVVNASVKIFRKLIDFALMKHETVHVVMAEGNHDLTGGGVWLPIMFKQIYENEPRVTVDDSEIPYYTYKFGKVMLGWHHGHRKPMAALPLYFASEFPKMWGSTVYRYAHTGHRHHKAKEKEISGMTVEQHQTLSAKDQHAVDGGYHANRAANSISYHSDYGEASRVTVTPEMVM